MRPGVLALALGLGILALPAAAPAQQPKRPYRIGVLHAGYFENTPSMEGLRAGLKAAGLEEGRDVIFDIRFTRGSLQAAPPAAAALVKAGVDLIFTTTQEHEARAAKAATATIPIVFTAVGDPVAAGLVKSIPHPGGNVTGVSSLVTELTPKRLEMLKAIAPGLRRAWAVHHADEFSAVAAARRAEEAGRTLKVEVLARAVRTPEELVQTLKGVRPGDGLLAPPSLTLNIPGVILDMVLLSRLPAVFNAAFWVKAGGLVSYGSVDQADAVQAARLVARILRGTRPQDLPVEGANKIELAVNLKTAKALGVMIPREILARAEHVIE